MVGPSRHIEKKKRLVAHHQADGQKAYFLALDLAFGLALAAMYKITSLN